MSLVSMVIRLAKNGLISLIWREQNHKQFQGVEPIAEAIVQQVKEMVKLKLSGKQTHSGNQISRLVCSEWV
ncbi:hypothetical protein V6N12_065276 [Hibiscus sabdariffa]|uniref:Uncharacterized protein n=1 Tax=Hibiscus sabdariffa TaxID=183260 RepID=A0ABR2G9P5_9ROSI